MEALARDPTADGLPLAAEVLRILADHEKNAINPINLWFGMVYTTDKNGGYIGDGSKSWV